MKQFIVFFVALFCALGASAQLNTKEKSFANSVIQFLAKEGIRSEFDKDEDIAFKLEETLYWISVKEEEEGYYFVTINRTPVDCEDADILAVRKAVNEVTKSYKVAKAYYSETNNDVRICAEGFYKRATDFTQFFSRYISILENIDEDLKEYYSEYSE